MLRFFSYRLALSSVSRRFFLAALMSMGIRSSLSVFPAWAGGAIQGARLADHGSHTRLVLDVGAKIGFQLSYLNNPYRIVLDFTDVDGVPSDAGVASTGLIQKVRFGQLRPGSARAVLDLSGPASAKKAFLLEPQGGGGWRFVLDIEPTTAEAFARLMADGQPQSPPASKAEPAKREAAAPQRAAPRKPVVMIDPGHGGIDPGAIGVSGVYEKTITLAMALETKKLLEATGRYDVRLTRESDQFVALRERVAISRQAGADLFISLHADVLQNTSVRGLSVYTLSENASDAEAGLLAEKENKADLIAGIDLSKESQDVTNILIDLAQRETMNLSAGFAAITVQELEREVKLLSRTHRFAGFAVLKAPDVPSILMELGYLSNLEEEKLLRQPAYRAKLAQALVRAVDRYFAKQGKAKKP